jgi:CheY-like chemotaxis protein
MKTTGYGNGLTILIIENHARLLRSMTFLLEIAGYETLSALNAQEALHAVHSPLKPDLILCDVDMVEIDAWALLRQLRRDDLSRPIPFVAISRYYELPDLVYALDQGATEYLAKPFDAHDLLDTVRDALRSVEMPQAVLVAAG